ncbi:MAG: hypothetical protein ACWA6X_07395 [Bauldia sp.]
MIKRNAFAALGLAAALVAGPAQADEVWQDGDLMVVWVAEDVQGYAVFSFLSGGPKNQRTGNIFLYGLRGDMTDRATFGGYWATDDPDAERCPMPIIDAEGNEMWTWGEVELTFDNRAFPSGWSAALGHCFVEAVEFWAVAPVFGGTGRAGVGTGLK